MVRTVLITGCSSGIGRHAALELSARGWRVLATCRHEKDCAALEAQGLVSFPLDYARPESVEAGAARTMAELGDGRLDLFNNGAFAIPGPIEDLSRAAMEAQFQANFLGWHDLTQRLIPAMRVRGMGRIVNCSSVLGLVSPPYRGAYSATKFALEAWSDALRLEMADAGIHVSLIEPGPIRTEFRRNAIRAFERWIDWETSARPEEYRDGLLKRLYDGSGGSRFELGPEAVTRALIRALEAPHPRARYFVTAPTHAVAVMRRFLPAKLIDRIVSRV